MASLFSTLAEALEAASVVRPPGCDDLLLKVQKSGASEYPANEIQGIIPVVVVGHSGMPDGSWRSWVRENAVAHYGPSYAEKLILGGIDLREMDPTRPFGRSLRYKGGWQSESRNYYVLDQLLYSLTVIEKWPSLYNLIVQEMGEEVITLREFLDRLYQLPSPMEVGEGRFSTLGDVIGRTVTAVYR